MRNCSAQKKEIQEPVPRYSFCSPTSSDIQPGPVELEPIAKNTIALHQHQKYAELLIVCEGGGSAMLEDQEYESSAPCAFILPARCAHSFNFTADTSGWVIHIEEPFLDQVNGRLTEFSTLWLNHQVVHFDSDTDEFLEILKDIQKLDEELSFKDVGYLAASNALLTSIFLQILRWKTPTYPQPDTPASVEVKLIQDFLWLVEESFLNHLKIGEYTSRLGVSSSQLRSACENVCGKPPIKIIHDRQLKEAKRCLLHTDMSTEQISDVLGFSSPTYFARFFKKETGLPASEYRRQYAAPLA